MSGSNVGAVTSDNYFLFLEPKTWGQALRHVEGAGVDAPDVDSKDPVMRTVLNYVYGRPTREKEYLRPSQTIGRDYKIKLEEGVLRSPLHEVAEHAHLKNCRTDVIFLDNCASDPNLRHWYTHPGGVFDEIEPTSALVSSGADDEAVFNQETTLRTGKRRLEWKLRIDEAQTIASNEINSVAFKDPECAGCSDIENIHKVGYYGGGQGGANPPIWFSTINRFSAGSAITNSIANGSYILAQLAKGALLLAGFGDNPDLSLSTTGGMVYSNDGGATVTAITGPSVAINDIKYFKDRYWACGADGNIWYSLDGTNWTQFTAIAGHTTTDWYAMAYDKVSDIIYLVGDGSGGGTSAVGRIFSATNSDDYTATVGAGADELYAVAVLADGHVIVGGAAGKLRENPDVNGSGSWADAGFSQSDDIRFVGGNPYRTLVGAGTNVYDRSPLNTANNVMMFNAINKFSGVTVGGNIVSGALGNGIFGLNDAIFGTDTGEILIVRSYLPNG